MHDLLRLKSNSSLLSFLDFCQEWCLSNNDCRVAYWKNENCYIRRDSSQPFVCSSGLKLNSLQDSYDIIFHPCRCHDFPCSTAKRISVWLFDSNSKYGLRKTYSGLSNIVRIIKFLRQLFSQIVIYVSVNHLRHLLQLTEILILCIIQNTMNLHGL